MNSIHLDYPILKLQKISAEEIPNALSQLHPEQAGFQIQGTDAVLISKSWLSYLLDTELEERFNDLLHRVLNDGEDPEPVLQFILLRLNSLNFRCIRRIAGSVRFTLEFLKIDIDNTPWESFLKQLDATANKMERIYRRIPHIDWVITGPNYTVMIICRDHRLRYLDVSPLMDDAPFDRVRDPEVFQSVSAPYGALTWFPDDDDLTIDVSPEWCYSNGIVIDPFEIAQAIQKNSPIRSLDISILEKPKLTAEQWSRSGESDSFDPEFLELWLPDCADDDFPVVLKSYFGNEADMKNYMDAVKNGPWATVHEHRLAAYQQYCDGDRRAKTRWKSRMIPLFTSHKVAYQQQMFLNDVHWLHVDHENRIIPLRARKIVLDQVLLEIGEEYLYCVRPSFEGLEQADFKSSQWVPITKTVFPIADIIDVQNGNYRARLYVDAGVFDSFALALTAIETPGQVDLTAVMDEFFGEFS